MFADQTLAESKAIILDATGLELTAEEADLFQAEKPAGFILFRRNCASKQQVTDLVTAMRAAVGYDAPVLIDQEGGSVARLRAPEWIEYPAARVFGDLAALSSEKALAAARLNSHLMGMDLIEMGITVNCAPVVDVPSADCHAFLSGSRTYGNDVEAISLLGEAVCRGLLDAGVTPVIKHIPGHGRAKVDSHHDLPVIDASLSDLSETDFKPFKYLNQSDMKMALWAMAAHVVYSDIDHDSAASVSRPVVDGIIRGDLNFDGVLIADDISMKALGGTVESRVTATMAAGMDLTMLCNASFEDRVAALSVTPKLTADAIRRLKAAENDRQAAVKQSADNKDQLRQELARMLENWKQAV